MILITIMPWINLFLLQQVFSVTVWKDGICKVPNTH